MSGPEVQTSDEASLKSDDTQSLVVGDEPCTFVEVQDALISCTSAGKLWSKLLQISRSLQLPDDKVISLKLRIANNTVSYPDELYEILETWRGKFSSNATLYTLVKVLEKNGLNDCGDALRIHYKMFDREYVVLRLKTISTWNDLPEHLKSWMKTKNVLFQGTRVKLEELTQQIVTPVDKKILDELANGNIPCLVSTHVPDKLEYYVHRTVKGRNKLKMGVLQHESKDVFVIEGIEKYHLSSLVGDKETTDESWNQLKKLTVRFILWQLETDFDKICKLANTPVHWIKYKNEMFELIASSGSVNNLQQYVDESQDSFLEKELALSMKGVCVIADSPGMGKSSLLANIAHQIMEREGNNMLIRFIVLKEFVDAFENKEINTDTIVKIIAEQSSEYEFGTKFVEQEVKTRPCVILFDGFDEVLSSQVNQAKQILKAVMLLPSARVFVATRPHFRDELENTLHVLGNTIQPFDEPNQIKFLINHWTLKGAKPNDSLEQFTKACVKQLTTKMSDSEKNIAGIPLQCRLLAEAYEEEAVRSSILGYDAYQNSFSVFGIHSMFGMYETHMKMRFEKICQQTSVIKWLFSLITKTNQHETIKQAHMYFALELLFPEHANEFKYLKPQEISLHDLCGLGILEATHSNDIRFVHRTFAEFLVAQFVHEKKLYSSQHQQFVRSTIFQTTKHDVYLRLPFWISKNIESFEFTLPVICYFLNGFAKKEIPKNFIIKQYHQQMLPFYMASAYHDYECLPFTMGHYVHHTAKIPSITNLLLITARCSGVELMKIFFSSIDISNMPFLNVEKCYDSDAFKLTPLHVAVYRGLYSLVEYLVQKFESKLNELRYLIHFCVYYSLDDGKAIVKDKIQIIKFLNAKNNQLINEQLLDQRTPLFQYKVHLELLECLIQEGADLNVIDKDGNTVLHKISKNIITGESYHRVVEALSKQDFQHFNKPNIFQETPLHLAMPKIELLPATLVVFLSKGGDLNEEDKEGDSVLFFAVRCGRSVELISKLIQLGADWKHRNRLGENALHISSQIGNLNTLKYLVETHKMDVDDPDNNRNTPLHIAVQGQTNEQESVQQFLIKVGANLNAENEFKKTPFVRAFEQGEGLSLSIIQLMEEHGLNITPKIASKALKSAFLRFEYYRIFSTEPDAEVLEYLMEKGGKVDFEFTQNFWKWEKVQNSMQHIIQHTTVTPKLLNKARTVGVLTEQECTGLEKIEESSRSKRFYEMVQEKPSSFERVFLILMNNQQWIVLDCLQRHLTDKFWSSLFMTPHPRLNELIFSDTTQSQVMVLVTSSTELSVRRIRETVDKYILVIEEQDVVNLQIQDELVVLKCELVTDKLVSKLMRFKGKFICICSNVGEDIEGCEILIDDYLWDDISSFYIDKLWFRIQGHMYNVVELFASPDIIGKLDKLEEYDDYKCRIAELNLEHATRHNDIAPFDKMSLDYLILEKVRDGVSKNVHLIEQNEDGFKSIQSKGSDENMRYPNEGTKLCDDFPFCNCNASEEVIFKFSIQFVDEKTVTCEININELLPRARRVLRIQDRIDLFELRRLLHHVQHQSTETDNQLGTMKLESNPYDDQIVTKCRELFNYLKCPNPDVSMKKLAVRTLFPHLVPNTNTDELDEYVKIGLLEWKESSLVFRHEILPWYFIAELLAEPEKVDFMSFDSLTNEIFISCFEAHTYHAEDCFLSIPSLRFTNKTVFKFLDSTAIKHSDVVSKLLTKYITPEIASSWIHACLNDNLLNLLKIVIACELHGKLFESLIPVVLAVVYADVNFIEWVTQQYENRNNQLVADIQLESMYPADKRSRHVSILHVAVKRGDPSVLEYLLDNHFNTPTNQHELLDILTPIYPGNRTALHQALFINGDKQVEFIRLLINNGANVNARDSEESTPLHLAVMQKPLPPRVIEIIRLLIENGADPDAVDEEGQTFVHCAPEFLTSELYHQLIAYLDSIGRRNSFNMIDSYNRTILHHAVRDLEPLECTLDILKKNAIDFNVTDKDDYSVLFYAIMGGRSTSFLKTLITFGADWSKSNNLEENPLHWAAKYGNLSALILFISLECDLNTSNLQGLTPLDMAVQSNNINGEIIDELINHGAVVSATNNNNNPNLKDPDNRTPLHVALCNYAENQLAWIKFLIYRGADANARDSRNLTPLHFAVWEKPLPPRVMEIISLLIQNGADPNAVVGRGQTFLHLAPYSLTPELYHELIVYFDSTGRKDALKAVTSYNYTHLHCAVKHFDPLLATLEIFKSNGIDFNGQDNDGDSVVFDAIEGGRNAKFLNILFTFGADWTITNKLQENALNHAARHGNLSAVKLFISLECEVNSRNITGHTPLHNSFLGKRYGQDLKTNHEIVVELLKHGADVNAKDNEGNLPIDLANKRAKNGFMKKRTMHLLQASSTTE